MKFKFLAEKTVKIFLLQHYVQTQKTIVHIKYNKKHKIEHKISISRRKDGKIQSFHHNFHVQIQ